MLGDVCESRDNGFNLLRLLAALGILAAHCLLVIPIENNLATQDTHTIRFMVDLLLAIFFVFSGFLITASLERSQDLMRFAVARGLRIFPGLIVVALVLAFIFGPAVTTAQLNDYFTNINTWAFVPSMAIALDQSASLPGLFEANPVAGYVDMPIWTLRYEVAIYVAFPFVYIWFLTRSDSYSSLFILVMFAIYFASQLVPSLQLKFDSLNNLAHFSVSFLVGASLWMYRRFVPNSILMVLILWIVFLTSFHGSLAMFSGVVAAGYTFIWIAYRNSWLLRTYNRFGDYSYGVYIIHFPIGQMFYQFNPSISPTSLLIQTFCTTMVLAILLWTLVEKPCLSNVKNVHAFLDKRLGSFTAELSTRVR